MNFQMMKDFMEQLTEWKVPGNSISVYKEGKEIFSYQTGYADVENRVPMNPDKLLNIYSCSKVATVTAALQLYEKGYFKLDDPVYSILPEYKDMCVRTSDDNIEKAKETMTIRHLFTMTSGLSYDTTTQAFRTARDKTAGQMNTRTVIECLASEPLSFEPGTRWQYSLSHDVLAAVVEVVSGQRFRTYVKNHLFEPLKMFDSHYENKELVDKMAEQYILEQDENADLVQLQTHGGNSAPFVGQVKNVGKANSLVFGPEYDSGGAGIITTVRDYAKFCDALANYGVGHNGERILSADTVELLRTNQLTKKQLEGFNWEQLKGYGYGLGVRTLIDKVASGTTGNIGEFGWGGAAGATVLVDPATQVSMFYAHHMLNPQEHYYQPRLRNILYRCL